MLKDALAKVAGEEQAVRLVARERGEETGFGDPQVLRLVDYGESVRPGRLGSDRFRDASEHVRWRHAPLGRQLCARPFKD